MDIPATTTAAKTAPLCQTVARPAALAHGMTADVQKDTMTEGSDKHYPDVGLIIRHRDGGPGEDPLFTDFTASNIGTPANSRLPYYAEDRPDSRGMSQIRQYRRLSMEASAVSCAGTIC
jgi:hypothetical protein